MMMQLGALIPFGDIGGDPAVLREYAQAAEPIGYNFIEAPHHVLGHNPAGQSAAERCRGARRRREEAVGLRQRLWAAPDVGCRGRWQTRADAGMNARPAGRKGRVWFGGHVERTLERIDKFGGG